MAAPDAEQQGAHGRILGKIIFQHRLVAQPVDLAAMNSCQQADAAIGLWLGGQPELFFCDLDIDQPELVAKCRECNAMQ